MKDENYKSYSQLMQLIKQTDKDYDINLIEEAYYMASKAHKNQKRVGGIEYIYHPISVAYILVELGMETKPIVAALLHDVAEDTSIKIEDIEKKFGKEISTLVSGVTKLKKIKFRSKEEEQSENIRKMFIAMAKDIRVIIIKLADRLNNMRTLKCMPLQKQRDKSRETMEVFVPIAHRLGIRQIKEELEDLSLRYLDPIAYREIEHSLALRKKNRERFIFLIKKKIMDKIKSSIANPHIEGRVKSINGIYKKVFIRKKSIDEIYDIYAVRIIVNTVSDCYNILGMVHDMFQPIPNRFKDYISTPKPNLYQSLHTTVVDKKGIPFEIQIRTWQMHRTAEYGIAAHWKYKLGMSNNYDKLKKNILKVNKIFSNQHGIDVTDIVGNIKMDLIPEEIFVLTPRGKVISLPNGSTVIDFAYAIHTDVGNKMIGAKVDKRIVPIDYTVKTGEIVEIITTKTATRGPSRSWLKIVKTGSAKNKIKQWFKREKREENIIEGKSEVERDLKRSGIILSENEFLEVLRPITKKNQFKTIDDFYAAIGYGGVQFWKSMPRIKEWYQKKIKEGEKKEPSPILSESEGKNNKNIKSSGNGVIVDGISNVLVKLAKCCNPIPGDKIIGFITHGTGISIHNIECKNVPKPLTQDTNQSIRWIKTYWSDNISELFNSNIEICAENKNNLLANITKLLSSLNIRIITFHSKLIEGNKIVVYITLLINDLKGLNKIMNLINGLNGVYSVKRIITGHVD